MKHQRRVRNVKAGLTEEIVRADVSWKDGITGALKIAHLAEAFGLNCEIHTTTMNYMDMANLHLSCAIKTVNTLNTLYPRIITVFP